MQSAGVGRPAAFIVSRVFCIGDEVGDALTGLYLGLGTSRCMRDAVGKEW